MVAVQRSPEPYKLGASCCPGPCDTGRDGRPAHEWNEWTGADVADNIAEQALAAERLRTAIDLRARGAHWQEVCDACGYSSPAAALRAVGAAMAAATQRAEETADSMRDTFTLRMGHLLGETMKMLHAEAPQSYDNDGNPTGPEDDRAVRLRAVDEARRLLESQAKMDRLYDKNAGDTTETLTVRIVGIDPSEII